jgi:hypothetical protein
MATDLPDSKQEPILPPWSKWVLAGVWTAFVGSSVGAALAPVVLNLLGPRMEVSLVYLFLVVLLGLAVVIFGFVVLGSDRNTRRDAKSKAAAEAQRCVDAAERAKWNPSNCTVCTILGAKIVLQQTDHESRLLCTIHLMNCSSFPIKVSGLTLLHPSALGVALVDSLAKHDVIELASGAEVDVSLEGSITLHAWRTCFEWIRPEADTVWPMQHDGLHLAVSLDGAATQPGDCPTSGQCQLRITAPDSLVRSKGKLTRLWFDFLISPPIASQGTGSPPPVGPTVAAIGGGVRLAFGLTIVNLGNIGIAISRIEVQQFTFDGNWRAIAKPQPCEVGLMVSANDRAEKMYLTVDLPRPAGVMALGQSLPVGLRFTVVSSSVGDGEPSTNQRPDIQVGGYARICPAQPSLPTA